MTWRLQRKQVGLPAGLVAFFLVLWLPGPADLPPEAQRMAAVAALMAIWWIGEALPVAGTALLPMVLFPLLQILPSHEVAREYGNHLVYLFLGGFMIALALERWGLHRRVALVMLVRLGGSPPRLVLGFMLAVALLSMWISNTATTLMMLPIGMAVVRHMAEHAELEGASPEEASQAALQSLGTTLMLAIAYSASAGGIATLIGTPPNIVLAGAVQELLPGKPNVSFARWMALGLPISIAMLVAVYLVVIHVAPPTPLERFRFSEAGTAVLRRQRQLLGPMSSGERRVAALFLTAVLLWMTRTGLEVGSRSIPGWSALFPRPEAVHDATVAIAVGLALMAGRGRSPSGETRPLLDWETVRHGTPWGILILFGGGFALAAGFEVTGLAHWIGDQLGRLQGAPVLVVIALVCLVTTFLTEVTSNTATSTMLMPILAATAVALDAPPLLLMVPAALSASCAFMLPVATPPNAIVFGTEWVTIPRMVRAGLVLNLVGVVIISLLAWWLVPRILVVAGP